ncbi:MAG: radical SAM family heme chaperone HemW [Thermoanaerobaculia bacterium]
MNALEPLSLSLRPPHAAPVVAARPGAYIHIPYCAHRCAYCSFTAFAGLDGEKEYFDALLQEIHARQGEKTQPLDSIYFGGGTPSYVEPARLASVLQALDRTFGIASDAEITAEGNPDDLDAVRMASLRSLGVNRLSIGVQSLVDAELIPLERRHDAASAVSALSRATRAFSKVSGDLMIGIPGQTRASLMRSLQTLLETGVGHVSVYLLELEKAPKLVAMKAANPELFPDDEEAAQRWEDVDQRCERQGLMRYELSNWARTDEESRHNSKYWLQAPTLGFGVSAHSFDGRVRRANSGSAVEYGRRVREEGTAFVSTSELQDEDALREGVMLGLRLREGVTLERYQAARETLGREDRERLDEREEAGLLTRRRGRIQLTRRGALLSNEVFALLV